VPRARGDVTKHFEVVDGDKYRLLKRPVTVEMPSLAGIRSLHHEYQQQAKNYILYGCVLRFSHAMRTAVHYT
jgi:hypothetical protein